MMVTKHTSGYDFSRISPSTDDWSAIVRNLWEEYLINVLGWTKQESNTRVELEISSSIHQPLLDRLQQAGWIFDGSKVVDVGCGTGALVTQLAQRHAYVIGVEPSLPWGNAAHLRTRASSFGDRVQILRSNGTRLPIKDQSVDYVFSLQVLEHIDRAEAKQVVHEITRVLKENGRAFIRFENYLSFWEPHYRVMWLPFMPKSMGAIYLKLTNRDPWFLLHHIHYRLGMGIALMCYEAGLIRPAWKEIEQRIKTPSRIRRWHYRLLAKIIRVMPDRLIKGLIVLYMERHQICSATFALELVRAYA